MFSPTSRLSLTSYNENGYRNGSHFFLRIDREIREFKEFRESAIDEKLIGLIGSIGALKLDRADEAIASQSYLPYYPYLPYASAHLTQQNKFVVRRVADVAST